MPTKYQGTGYPNGFNPNTKKPIDVRLLVDTLADRNTIEFTHPAMRVTVLGPLVSSGGVDSYPYMASFRCLVDKQPTFGGYTTTDADWVRDDAPSGLTAGGYKGAWNATTNTPDLTDAALLTSLQPGSFYKVQVAGATALNGVAGWQINDSAFWDGTRWQKFDNTNPNAIQPLYGYLEGAKFTTDVLNLIRLNTLVEWGPGLGYQRRAYVKHSYLENGKPYVDTFMATADMGAAAAGLPTPQTPNPNWELITTTNGARLGGTALGDDTVGRAATGTFRPANPTQNTYLSPEETDARIKQYAGGGGGPLLGGNAATFLTADPAETPRN